ncbi:hypothetical protein HYU96_01925 [Candidatus Daviesbacteria bacterium]|nr:hypothetical protein [Candidatus Daviesbacteria bacterium]
MVNIKTFLIFGLTAALVIFLEYDLLKPIFDVGLTPEDREFILRYKTLGPNPLTKIFEVWSERGAYSTIPIYYLGIVESFTGFNYQLIQTVGVFLRTLAILSIFPLVLIVFKNKWLAIFTTILFSISYPTTGALETGVEQSEYLGFLIMNIFLIAYYYLNTKYLLQFKWLILSSLLLFMAVIISVMRIYPILFFLPVIEVYLFFRDRTRFKFMYMITKLAIFYFPFLVLVFYFPFSATGHFTLPTILSKIADGNWQLILTPLQGLGFMIPISKYYGKLGAIDLSSFDAYLIFLLGSPLVIFGFGSFLLSWIITKNPTTLFLRIFTLNLGFDLLIYWIVRHKLFIPSELRLNYDIPRLYPVFFGLFILSLTLNFFVEWLRLGKKNNLFLVLWLGPFISLFYITVTYFYASLNLSFAGAQDHYLLIPAFGISLLIAGILLLLHNKLSNLKFGSTAATLLIAFLLLMLYGLNKALTHDYFNEANAKGRAAAGQIEMQTKIRQKLEGVDYSRPLMVYFDTQEISGDGPFYSESLLTPFPFFMHLAGEKILDGCIGVIYDNRMIRLKELTKKTNNQLVVEHPAICVDGYSMITKNISIKIEDLYAYKIKDRNLIDIKQQVIDELEIK